MISDLHEKVAVITGGGSGIGRATALALAREGAHVVVADIDGARAEAVAAEASALGTEGLGVRTDVGRDDDLQALRDTTIARFGHVDVVMNNVGVLALGDPPNIPLSAWERTINLNLMSVARSLHAFLPDLLGQGSGHIVNTASTAGLWGYAYDHLAYSASKGAVVALSEALVLYTRPRGVGVTCLCPGPVSTNIAEQVQVFGEIGAMQPPPLGVLEPEVVGAQVVAAIKADTFFLPTHPEEVHDILVQKAHDTERFIADQVGAIGISDVTSEAHAPQPTVGFIGLGSQGAPMAQRIIDAGYPTVLWARRAETLAPFTETNAHAAATPAELAAQSDIVGICVVNDDDVEAVINGPDGLAASLRPGSIVAIHSTIHPDSCVRLGDALAAMDVSVLDAPVSGGGGAAAEGHLLVMVGGEEQAFERALPVLSTFGDPVRLLGALGSGQLAKLVNNLLFTAELSIAHDAIELGSALGLDATAARVGAAVG